MQSARSSGSGSRTDYTMSSTSFYSSSGSQLYTSASSSQTSRSEASHIRKPSWPYPGYYMREDGSIMPLIAEEDEGDVTDHERQYRMYGVIDEGYESAGSSSSRSRSNRSRAYTRPGSQSRMTPVEVVPVDEGVGTESHFIPNPKTYWSNQYQQGFSRSPSNHSHAKTRSIGTARHTLAAGGSQFQAGMNQSELKHQEAERTNRGAERVDAWRHDVLYVPKAELKKKPTPPSEYLASKSTKARLESAARKDSVSQAQAKSRAAPTSSVAPKGSTKQLDGNKLPASTLNSRKLKQHLWARELLTNRSHPDWLTLINIYDEGAMQESERLNTAARVGSSSRHSSSRAGSPNGLSGIASQAGRDAASAGLSEASAGLPTFREKLRDILSCLLNVAYPEASRPATTARRARRSTRSDNRRY